MDQRLKQDKQICLFYWIFTSSSLVLTSIDFGIDTKLNSRLITLQHRVSKNWHSVLNRVGRSEIRVLKGHCHEYNFKNSTAQKHVYTIGNLLTEVKFS